MSTVQKTKVVELEQGSQAWLDYRNQRVGASDLPVILGLSKFCTPFQLWQRKLGFLAPQKTNFAMQRGTDNEPFVREIVNLKLKTDFEPIVVQHPELDWAIASLDGYDDKTNTILEIKCTSLANHRIAEEKKIPEMYWPQVQWQLFCSGAKSGYYASFFENEVEVVSFDIDETYIAETLLQAASDFYSCLVNMQEPSKIERDVIHINDPQFELYAKEWKAADEMLKFYEKKVAHYKEKLIGLTDDSSCSGAGIEVKRVFRDGSIDYKKIYRDMIEAQPELSDKFCLDKYKKDSIGYWKVRSL